MESNKNCRFIFLLIGLFLSLSFSFGVFSQTVSEKGLGTVSYSKPSPDVNDKAKAYQNAQINAVERYYSNRTEADYEFFYANRDKIIGLLDDFIVGTTVLDEKDQPSLNKYSVSVKVDINQTKLNVLMRKTSAASLASSDSKSKIAFIFLGREVASSRTFDSRVNKRAEVEMSNSSSASNYDGQRERSKNSSISVETGGSTLRKADDKTFRAFPLSDQRSAITSVFSQGGFKVVDSDLLLSDRDIKAIVDDYSSGNDLKPSTKRGIFASLRTAGIPLFVLATVNIDLPTIDTASGLMRDSVRVSASVYDVSDGSEVASVPPVTHYGKGVTNEDAVNLGIKNGSMAGAKEVVSRLNSIGTK
jgi:hypothetical protein